MTLMKVAKMTTVNSELSGLLKRFCLIQPSTPTLVMGGLAS